jgi:hypothetical protein
MSSQMTARLVSTAPCSSNYCRIEPQVERQVILVEMTMMKMMGTVLATTERMIGGILDADQPEAAMTIHIVVDQVGAPVLHATRCMRRSSF